MIVASGLSLKFQVVGYHKLLLTNPGLYNFVEVLRRLINRGAYTQEEQKKHFEMSCSSAYQNMFYIYWFLIKLQNITINQNWSGVCS